MDEIESHAHSVLTNPKGSSKRSAKALFTLAYMVSYELKKLLQMPHVKQLLNPSNLSKFQSYFKQSIDVLLQDELSQHQELGKKKIRFSACFVELAKVLHIPLDPQATQNNDLVAH